MIRPRDIWRRVPARGRKWTLRFAVVFALYLVLGFFVVPAIVKSQLLNRLPPLTKRQAAVRQVKFNPLALSLTIRGLGLTETNGAAFASFEEFYANFQLSSLFRWAWTFDELGLQQPRVEVILGRDGKFNFANLLEQTNAAPKKEGKPGSIPRVLVFNLAITNGHVGFADLSHKTPFRTAYAPFNLHLTRFTTKPDLTSPYSFEASSDTGRDLAWAGTVTAQPAASSGTLRIAGIQLAKHAPYLEDFTRAQLFSGDMDVAGGYRFALGTNGMDLVVSNLAVLVTNVQLKDPDTGEVVVAVPAYELRDGSLDWRARQARVGSLVVTEPVSLVRRRADGSINLPSLVLQRITSAPPPTNAPPPGTGPAEPPWVFTLDDYRLDRGAVQFEDAAVPGLFRTTLKPFSIRVQHFSTATNSDAAFTAQVVTEAGEKGDLDVTYSINPVRARGSLKLTAFELKKYQPYLVPFFRGTLASGKSDVALELNHALIANAHAVTVSNASVRVVDVQVKSPDRAETWVALPSFSIEDASASLGDKSVHVGAIKSTGASVVARRERNGTINLLALLASPTNAVAGTNTAKAIQPAPPSASDGWRVLLDELALRDCAIHFEDRTLPRPGVVKVDQASVTVRGAQFPSNAPVQVEVGVRINAAGTAGMRATVWPYTPAADATMSVAGLDLRDFQPWLDTQVKLAVERGALSTTGRVLFGAPDGKGPKLQFAGDLAITNFLTLDGVLSHEFVRWDELAVKGIDAELQPNKAALQQVRFAGLKTSVIIGPDKRPNFLAILPPPRTNAAAAAQPAAASAHTTASSTMDDFPVELGELKLEKTAIHFGDQSIQPPCLFDLQRLDGRIKRLSSKPGTMAEVDISGLVDEAAPFAVRGTVNPLARELSLNVTITNQNLQLTPFTPYMEKYAGYPLNKGRMSVQLSYAVEQKKVDAKNVVRIDELMLGAHNSSPDATKLPVKLAIALLKDRHGRIELDVPVEGRLDDPQFRVAPIILKVIVNLIAKAATSPFKLLGALVGGGEELSFVDFQPGLALFLEGETNKLDKLGKALDERPAINLEIAASVDPVTDRDALARALVKQQMETLRREELSAAGVAVTNGFAVEPVEYERLLRAAVVKTFGTNVGEVIRDLAARAATNQVAASRPPPRKAPGFFARVKMLFKPGPERAAAAQARQQAKADAVLLKQNPEVAILTAADMNALLATKTEVPADHLRQLMQDRAHAVQVYLLGSGKVTAERLLLVAPKATEPAAQGTARVNLSLN